jgi:hypothetical protein
MRRVVPLLAGAAVLLIAVPTADASVRVGWLSQQDGPGRASAEGSVEVSSRTPATSGSTAAGSRPTPVSSGREAPRSLAGTPLPATPTLPSNSPRLSNPRPQGPGSFWYTTENGERCEYSPASNGSCFRLVEPAGAAAEPPINPAALAATAAERLSLTAGGIQASPSVHLDGLTGALSWFWLSPTPEPHSLTVALRGERVTVSASASNVSWSFGEGTARTGGPGIPYRDGPAPAGAVRHLYQTRCLPGDAGRDPYVLASCGADGYTVAATVNWTITYTASGRIGGGGSLPSRTTSTSIAYPVSEARSFLTSGGSS